MNEEPKLIDVFAALVLPAIVMAFRGEDTRSATETAYEYANEMMKAREKYVSD
jgi:hypothetical protein